MSFGTPTEVNPNDPAQATSGKPRLGPDLMADLIQISDRIAKLEGQFPGITAQLGNYLLIADNLSDLQDASAARTNLGLGTAAIYPSADFLQAINNGSDISNKSTFRSNVDLLQASQNGADIPSKSAFRSNLKAAFGGLVTVSFPNTTKSNTATTLGWGLANTPTGFAVAVSGDYGQGMMPFFTGLGSNGVSIGCYSVTANTSNVSIMWIAVP